MVVFLEETSLSRCEKLLGKFHLWKDTPALIHRGVEVGYRKLEEKVDTWSAQLRLMGICSGDVVGLQAEYSTEAIALLLALLRRTCVVAMVPPACTTIDQCSRDGRISRLFQINDNGTWSSKSTTNRPNHSLLEELHARGGAGLIIYSSGSTGHPKAILHDLDRFLTKFDKPGKRLSTLAFLMFDHIAGLDTLFYTLSAGGTLVLPESRNPNSILRLIQDHRVNVLPASPTFLNLLILSGDIQEFDTTDLQIITYGSEPMGQLTLNRLRKEFPTVRIVQKYGTSEFGSPRSRSRSDDSLWLQFKSDEMEYRILDGILWLRGNNAMLGYLNLKMPVSEDGWWCTGDVVEQDGDWIRFVGRESDIIIVGGEKVYPQEVEEALLEMDCIADARVQGESQPLSGQMVVAYVNLTTPLTPKELRKSVRRHCNCRIENHKIPVKLIISKEPLGTDRQKKVRRSI